MKSSWIKVYSMIIVGAFYGLSIHTRQLLSCTQCSSSTQVSPGYQDRTRYPLLRKNVSRRIKDWPDNYTKQRVSSYYNTPENLGTKMRRNSWN